MNEVNTMQSEYDFSNARKNPYILHGQKIGERSSLRSFSYRKTPAPNGGEFN